MARRVISAILLALSLAGCASVSTTEWLRVEVRGSVEPFGSTDPTYPAVYSIGQILSVGGGYTASGGVAPTVAGWEINSRHGYPRPVPPKPDRGRK